MAASANVDTRWLHAATSHAWTGREPNIRNLLHHTIRKFLRTMVRWQHWLVPFCLMGLPPPGLFLQVLNFPLLFRWVCFLFEMLNFCSYPEGIRSPSFTHFFPFPYVYPVLEDLLQTQMAAAK